MITEEITTAETNAAKLAFHEGKTFSQALRLLDDYPDFDAVRFDAALEAVYSKPEKPRIMLPGGNQSITDTASSLGCLLAGTQRFFRRGTSVAKLVRDPDGLPALADVRSAELASDFETVANIERIDAKTGKPVSAICSEQAAKLIAASASFGIAMPPINVLTRSPVLIERGGRLLSISGYDRASGIYAAGKPIAHMELEQAKALLCECLDGFKFATPPDRARALAAIITPALVFGGLMGGRAPVDLGEADASQTGKGYRNKITSAIYNHSVKTVTQQRAGVGSMEESFNTALIRGANFIALDNVRGKIDSPGFESFLTEDVYIARAPFREPVEIDPRRVVVMMTSNKADVTTDLANRCACVRLLKRDDGHAWATYPEGDILEHIRANQPRFLGAVFAVVRAWYDTGKPRTVETRHDFRRWAQTMDWITQHILDAGPLLDGHRETQARMTNPVLNWVRDVALEVIRAKQSGAWLKAGDIVDLLAETTTETPGFPEHGDLSDSDTRKAALQSTGRRLSLCFRAGDIIVLDGMQIERREEYVSETRYTVREYMFLAAADEFQPLAAKPSFDQNQQSEGALTEPEFDFAADDAADDAADEQADKLHIAADAADTTLYRKILEQGDPNIPSMAPISRISRKPSLDGVATEQGEI